MKKVGKLVVQELKKMLVQTEEIEKITNLILEELVRQEKLRREKEAEDGRGQQSGGAGGTDPKGSSG